MQDLREAALGIVRGRVQAEYGCLDCGCRFQVRYFGTDLGRLEVSCPFCGQKIREAARQQCGSELGQDEAVGGGGDVAGDMVSQEEVVCAPSAKDVVEKASPSPPIKTGSPSPATTVASPRFDRLSYQREYMRKRRERLRLARLK